MGAVQIEPQVHWVGVNDHTTDLFEGLWPLQPAGVSYNAYLVDDAEPALIDPVRVSKSQMFLEHVAEVVDPAELSYLILHHMEQDHTSSLNILRRVNPDCTIVCTEKATEMLESFYGITENVTVVEDGDTLELGETTLQFFSTPFVHWPETMMTYDPGRRVLFSGDAFGTFGTVDGTVFAEDSGRVDFYEEEGLRYFADVVAKFSKMVLRAIDKLADVPVDVIAPAHGPIWRERPEQIVEWYVKWSGYAAGPAEPRVSLVYGSMYGFTERMAQAVAEGVAAAGVPFDLFDAGRVHPGFILPSIWRSSGVLIGAPTYEGEVFPPLRQLLQLVVTKSPKSRTAGFFGSHGWAGGAGREVQEILEPLEWQFTEPVGFAGKPTQADLDQGRALGRAIADSVQRP